MDQDADKDAQAQIRRLISSWTEALRSRNVDALMKACALDFVSFDLAPPLSHSVGDYREETQQWFASFATPIACDVSQLEIASAGDVAFSRSLNRMTGKKTSGEELDLWVRATICYRRIGGSGRSRTSTSRSPSTWTAASGRPWTFILDPAAAEGITMIVTQRITPCLWFDGQAEEAANQYVSIFENSKITAISRYGEVGPGPKGSVMTVSFILDGQAFIALNGGPEFKFTEAISMMVNCETQAEVDYYWNKLGDAGEILECGWLKDRFGLSWQIVPTALIEMIEDEDPVKSQRVMAAMLQMTKLDLAKLKQAYDG